MGVYVKGMNKKPKDCKACFLGLYDRQAYCRNGEQSLCPLIEVKTPHGRLIDARKWHKRLQKQAMTLYGSDNRTYGLIMDIMDAIHTEPTVIEAEESE